MRLSLWKRHEKAYGEQDVYESKEPGSGGPYVDDGPAQEGKQIIWYTPEVTFWIDLTAPEVESLIKALTGITSEEKYGSLL